MRRTLYIQPDAASIAAAKRGLEARKKAQKSKRGGLDPQQAHAEGVGSGVARARDIIAGKRVNAYQVKAFFDRHRNNYINAKLKKLKPEESKAIQAWLLWGGEPLRKLAIKAIEKDKRQRSVNPRMQNPGITKPIAFMRLRHLDRPKDLLDLYDKSELVVQQKYDGFKVMAIKGRRGVRLYSRRGKDLTSRVPHIAQRIDELLKPGDVILGEMVYYHRNKQALEKAQSILLSKTQARAMSQLKKFGGQMRYAVYDMLAYQGKDLAQQPLSKRKTVLNTLFPARGLVHVVKDYTWGQRKRAMKESLATGGEGVVIKVKDSSYKYRKLGQSEPFGLWWKFKPPGETAHTADVILTKYKKGKEKLIFDAYQIDGKKRILVGRLSGMDKDSERAVKLLIDRGKEVVAEVSYQKRLPSQKLRHMGWVRLRMDKPAASATVEQKRSKRKKRSKISKEKVSNPQPYAMYVTVEESKSVSVYPFRSEDFVMPATVANEFRLALQQKHPRFRVQSLTDKELAKYLRKVGKPVKRGKRMRVQNPRRSVLKDALAVEALHYNDFEDFAKAYWENCARGIYWYPTNDKGFAIGPAEKKLCEEGKFFISCNPELALASSRGKGKKYVAEIDASALGSKDYRIKRGSKGSEIKIVRNLNKAKVLRVLRGDKAMRSLIWQQSILPSSKDELRKFYDQVMEKEEARREKEEKKRKIQRERDARRGKFLAEEKAAKKGHAKAKAETEEKLEKKKVKKKIETRKKKKGFKKARSEVKREQEERRKKRASKKKTGKKKKSKALAKNPTRAVSPYVNNPG